MSPEIINRKIPLKKNKRENEKHEKDHAFILYGVCLTTTIRLIIELSNFKLYLIL